MSAVPVVAVDGPGGTGKGTLCAALARELGWHLLDSGALYRLVALAAHDAGVAIDDQAGLVALAAALPARFTDAGPDREIRVWLGDRDVTEAIRSEACGSAASKLAALPPVRTALLARQHAFRRPPGLIADGRDMGSVVFPDAALKIFLTASPEERASRRYKQLKAKGNSVNLRQLLDDIARRDARDAQRRVSPLKPASDAVVLDTTQLSIAEVQTQVLALMRQRGLAP